MPPNPPLSGVRGPGAFAGAAPAAPAGDGDAGPASEGAERGADSGVVFSDIASAALDGALDGDAGLGAAGLGRRLLTAAGFLLPAHREEGGEVA